MLKANVKYVGQSEHGKEDRFAVITAEGESQYKVEEIIYDSGYSYEAFGDYEEAYYYVQVDDREDYNCFMDYWKEAKKAYNNKQHKINSEKEEKNVNDLAIKDYEKGREFPDNGNFNGLGNYHIIAELNDVVLGVRNTDFTYATWQGDSEYGVSGGNYMMTREKAFSDFALRAQLIDSDRYIDPEKERKDYEELLNENLDFNGSSLSEKQFNELIDRIIEDAHSEKLKRYIVETNIEVYREENLFNDDPLDLSEQSTSNKL